MSGKAHTTKETVSNEETNEKVNSDTNAEQTTSEESGSTSGQTKSEQVDNFAQMYDMLTERDKTIKDLTTEVANLKKENTNLLLKVNASAPAGDKIKNPYEKFIDSMVER